jgi:hypothetical protein
MLNFSVSVPAVAIRNRLVAAGFHLAPAPHGEEVYVRVHDRDARYSIKVYSAIERGATEVRLDLTHTLAVRALFDGSRKSETLFEVIWTHRTGGVEVVLDRMVERAQEAYAACNSHRNGGKVVANG